MVRYIALVTGFFSGLVFMTGCPHECATGGPLDTSQIPSDQGPLPDEMTVESKQSKAGMACANLRALQCKDGFARKYDGGVEPSCTVTMQKSLDTKITYVPVDCIIGAKTKHEARMCGSYVECP